MLPREALSTVADDSQVSFETVPPLFVSHSSRESVVRAVLLFRLVVACLLVKKTGLVELTKVGWKAKVGCSLVKVLQ